MVACLKGAALADSSIPLHLFPRYRRFWRGYIGALCFTSITYREDEDEGGPLFSRPGVRDFTEAFPDPWSLIAPRLLDREKLALRTDAESFFMSHYAWFARADERAGNTFHYVRNGHGVSFTDDPDVFGEEESEHLAQAAFARSTLELEGSRDEDGNLTGCWLTR